MSRRILRFFYDTPVITVIFAAFLIAGGIYVAPFDWDPGNIPRDPVAVDAIPDIGENQQIVFTEWPGRSPEDIEDQVTYPLTVALMGIPGVKTIRSSSMLGFSSIYVIFEEDRKFYWSRSRLLEKLSSLSKQTLPEGVAPRIGPDATGLGQVFWYTLEGRDAAGNPAPGWSLEELRSLQDWQIRPGLMSAWGVSEVASVGGHRKEYHIDVDPGRLRYFDITLEEVFRAVQESNRDVGARTMEINHVEYVLRGVGQLESLEDLREVVVASRDNVPIFLSQVATVRHGFAPRRGVLDKAGAESVGGVVVARYGENPLAVIDSVHAQIEYLSRGLPEKELADGRRSQVTIVPFYDRSELIHETIQTLNDAIILQILITILVVIVLLKNIRASLAVALVLPMAVLMSFLGMYWGGVDANIVSLSGIAIAIGTIVDMGIILSENALSKLRRSRGEKTPRELLFDAVTEIAPAIVTAVLTTVVSFLPVFTMEGAEGKLFKPLAFTKTFALIASIVVSLTIVPTLLLFFFGTQRSVEPEKKNGVLIRRILTGIFLAVITLLLSVRWAPLGVGRGSAANLLFVIFIVGIILGFFMLLRRIYVPALRFFLRKKSLLFVPAGAIVVLGLMVWLGARPILFFIPDQAFSWKPLTALSHAFPGMPKQFMPPLDEGSYLYMPTTMPHASLGEVKSIIQRQDAAIAHIPEVTSVVGKLGRVESPLDPAPLSMIETMIEIAPEYRRDSTGNIGRYARDDAGEFLRDDAGNLIPHRFGAPYRQWRDHIRSGDDVWDEIVQAAQITGVTSAPRLQPISARIVMLQSGMRAPMGVKVQGPDLKTIESFSRTLEEYIQNVPGVRKETVFSDRIIGKPYLEIHLDRTALAHHGLSVKNVQNTISLALGGTDATTTVEGRERYDVRIRYHRDMRGLHRGIADLKRLPVSRRDGTTIPLQEIADVTYRQGPQVIKSEDSFLTGYVLFDAIRGESDVGVVRAAQAYLEKLQKSGDLEIPPGVSYRFAGSYEQQVRSEQRLMLILPVALLLIFMLLYLQFRRISTTLLVFSGIAIAWSGGFILLGLYGQEWFLDWSFFGVSLQELFQIEPVQLSVAIWVGFLALFGIATDDGVVIGTYLEQEFRADEPSTVEKIREATVQAAARRVGPALMTSATTILALLPVLTARGRGADVMIPMAIPTFGGMILAVVTIFTTPVLYAAVAEWKIRRRTKSIPRVVEKLKNIRRS
jgi:Cu(I)/Ag(I) efflux system membrane protein CusA/SilA